MSILAIFVIDVTERSSVSYSCSTVPSFSIHFASSVWLASSRTFFLSFVWNPTPSFVLSLVAFLTRGSSLVTVSFAAMYCLMMSSSLFICSKCLQDLEYGHLMHPDPGLGLS